jgi:hypothetical protein
MPLLAVVATTMDTTDRLVQQDGSPGSGSGQSQVRRRAVFTTELNIVGLDAYCT